MLNSALRRLVSLFTLCGVVAFVGCEGEPGGGGLANNDDPFATSGGNGGVAAGTGQAVAGSGGGSGLGGPPMGMGGAMGGPGLGGPGLGGPGLGGPGVGASGSGMGGPGMLGGPGLGGPGLGGPGLGGPPTGVPSGTGMIGLAGGYPPGGLGSGSGSGGVGGLPPPGAGGSSTFGPGMVGGLPGTAPGTQITVKVAIVATRAEGNGKTLVQGLEEHRAKPGDFVGAKRLPNKSLVAGWSWMVELLPYLGHQDIYSKFDFKTDWMEGDNVKQVHVIIPAFTDPSNPNVQWQGYPLDGAGLSHFVGMSGVEDARNVVAASLPRNDPRAGIFGYERIATTAEITDGTSQTIMIMGSGNLCGPWVSAGGATIRGARAPYFDNRSGFGSPGTSETEAQVIFADGSAKMISKDVDPMVFKALCTMHGNDSVDLATVKLAPVPPPPATPAGTSATITITPGAGK